MKIALVAIHAYPSPQAVPLACAFLKGYLLADALLGDRIQVEIVECFAGDEPETCAGKILAVEPDLVAFSLYVWGAELGVAIAKILHQSRPELILCAGGAEASANPAPLFRNAPFDFLVQGEGEAPLAAALCRLLGDDGVHDLPGILLPGAASAAPAPPVPLEKIPSPYLCGLLDPPPGGAVLWQLSRGCDFCCAFCFDGKTAVAVRRFPMERIEAELRLLVERQVTQVFVLDSTFNKVPQRAKEVLRLIRKIAPMVHFHFEVRSEFIDAEMAELFASITCSLQIGLQSADAGVLAAAGRKFNRYAFEEKIYLLNEAGAIFGFDLIYGLPGDNLKLFRDSLDFALSLYPNHLDIFPLAVLPGTRLFSDAQKAGLQHLPSPPYTITATAGFSRKELDEARRLARGCDIFYSRGKAVAWFNSVCAGLKLAPSAFLDAFAQWIEGQALAREEEDLSDREVWRLQHDFLQEVFRARKKERLLPVALDLAYYHHLYAEALLAAPPAIPSKRALKGVDLLATPLAVPPSAALARFNYPILELLEAGEVELAPFSAEVPKSGSYAIIYPFRGEVRTEDLPRPYFQLLEKLDGRSLPKDLLKSLRIPKEEALDFLATALSEGMVVLPARL
ncbi:radical SAM protein [Geomonas sp. RF6]|uniref:B12-binding domain-containing radical SAM protein n=1 Tax=Geomonas sp. RF6 TaxID=2897342 RepID=UPI001E5E3E84|nr:B12-binding domain-containing radical SAM protein [Geomonas sp. RF6]UFS71968.1 radical SAM protein [Geomonas sp. RF6]